MFQDQKPFLGSETFGYKDKKKNQKRRIFGQKETKNYSNSIKYAKTDRENDRMFTVWQKEDGSRIL